jgi:hypothetical protein
MILIFVQEGTNGKDGYNIDGFGLMEIEQMRVQTQLCNSRIAPSKKWEAIDQ